MRVNELARELNLQSKVLLEKLRGLNIEAKSHSSTLTPAQLMIARNALSPAPKADAPATDKPAAAEKAKAPATVHVAPAVSAAVQAPSTEPSPPAAPPPPPAPQKKVVLIRGPIIVREFAEQLGLKPNQLIAELMGMNVFASINQRIELKVAQQLAEKHGCVLEHEKKASEKKPLAPGPGLVVEPTVERPEEMLVRPPVVAFMGHVDHGKTSLLDRIRNTKVAAGEAGGITQHIGAYSVRLGDRSITFLDTPGHEAFTSMRARGANLTDIVVIVIDAVDGVMPQTREAIQHAKAANVNIMVAINKIDLRAANVERVKQQLQQEGLSPEDWGGSVVCCPVSAVTGQGIDDLLEMILLQAEVLELKANPKRRAQGYVIEAQMEPGRGPTATLLVRRGTLNVGDPMVCGACWGRVKALMNDRGERVKSAGPSDAVKCTGLPEVPEAGAEFVVYATDREAREIAEQRAEERRAKALAGAQPRRASIEDLLKRGETKESRELSLIIKADTQGSLEAIQHALNGIKSDKVKLKTILSGVGNITVNDILLASASDALVIGFHISTDAEAGSMAKREGVQVRLYSIIYELIDEVRDIMQDLLEPVLRETVIGHAEVRQMFDLGKKGRVAGCLVKDGRVTSRARARVKRGGTTLFVGAVATLRRFQNDAAEVREGQECGIRLDNFGDFQPGDIIELYEVEKIAQKL